MFTVARLRCKIMQTFYNRKLARISNKFDRVKGLYIIPLSFLEKIGSFALPAVLPS